jgi:hypothetical protein
MKVLHAATDTPVIIPRIKLLVELLWFPILWFPTARRTTIICAYRAMASVPLALILRWARLEGALA